MRKKKMILIIIACIGIIVAGLMLYGKYQISKIPELSFEEALEYTTNGNKDAIISVGIIKDGTFSFTVYGENGTVLPSELHTYEIGSITKTFTAALISKAILDEKMNLSDTIDKYLLLPEGNHYPIIEQLLTHTSGYKGYYFEYPMISNFFTGRNGFYGIKKEMLLKKISDIDLSVQEYSFKYSNFGYAVLGLVAEAVYQEDYVTLMNQYLQEELQLQNTKISDGYGDLQKYWDWQEEDAYISAGAITSDIADMLAYAQIQMDGTGYVNQCHESLKNINASTKIFKTMGIHLDKIGMSWIIDNENNIIWHNGGTGNYNSYIGFNSDTHTAVVVLSNLSPGYRIPATILGVKLLRSLQ